MSSFKKQIKTKKNKEEMKEIVNKLLIDIPMMRSIVSNVEWQGDKLNFKSKLGDGFFIIYDNLVELEINLSLAGRVAVKQLDKVIDDEFARLDP